MKKQNLGNKIEEYFENEKNDIPQFSEDEKEKLKDRIFQNKQKRKVFVRKKFAFISAIILVVLIPSILIPVLTIGNTDNTKYYSDTDVIQEELTTTFVQSYINENYSKYSFIFDECEVTYSYGLYSAEDPEELLSINIELFMFEPPFATIKFDIIANKGLDLYKYDQVKEKGEKLETENNIRYSLDFTKNYETNRKEYIMYSDYDIFLDIDRDDDEVFNKFY